MGRVGTASRHRGGPQVGPSIPARPRTTKDGRPYPRCSYVVTRSRPYLSFIHSGLGIGINPYRLSLALRPTSGIFQYEPPAQVSLAQAVPSGRIRQYVRFAPSVSLINAMASSRSIGHAQDILLQGRHVGILLSRRNQRAEPRRYLWIRFQADVRRVGCAVFRWLRLAV